MPEMHAKRVFGISLASSYLWEQQNRIVLLPYCCTGVYDGGNVMRAPLYSNAFCQVACFIEADSTGGARLIIGTRHTGEEGLKCLRVTRVSRAWFRSPAV